ncbi:MAG: hypothetical protein MSC43_04585 [Clostridiales bacterium]|nr:hypothetical protein [Clostridiales bacterium]MDD7432591.1 hypothetical protein [Clostridiales bacterium]MDY3061818.1 hypothetical protein [Eubacteriales bacterium]
MKISSGFVICFLLHSRSDSLSDDLATAENHAFVTWQAISYFNEAIFWIDSSRARSKPEPFTDGHAIPCLIKAAALLLIKNKMEATNIH